MLDLRLYDRNTPELVLSTVFDVYIDTIWFYKKRLNVHIADCYYFKNDIRHEITTLDCVLTRYGNISREIYKIAPNIIEAIVRNNKDIFADNVLRFF